MHGKTCILVQMYFLERNCVIILFFPRNFITVEENARFTNEADKKSTAFKNHVNVIV